MSRIFSLIVILALTSCSAKKIIYVASSLADCENTTSEKCLQVKENKEDEWTLIANDIEGFEYAEGVVQKIEVSIDKIKNPPANESAIKYKFVKLIYKEVPPRMVMSQNYSEKWQVNAMIGMDSLAKKPTLIFNDGKVSGNAGCNNYGAAFTLAGNEIIFGLTHATKMYCPNMKIETAYFDCLSRVKTYTLLENELTFFDAQNSELVRFNSLKE